MGLIVYNYTTDQGFVVPELYIQVTSIRMLKTLVGPNYGMLYTSLAYKSVTDKDSGASPISIPNSLSNVEDYLTADSFYNQTIFGFAYDAIKQKWENAGYLVANFYPQPPTPTTYIYDCSGYSFQGLNCAGKTKGGYDRNGLNAQGWDKDGFDIDGFNLAGYNRAGFDRDGYNKNGYDMNGFNKAGYNALGLNRQGYDIDGYNNMGYAIDGYNREGYNIDALDRDGNPKPTQ